MHCGGAKRYISSLVVLASLFSSGAASLSCPLRTSTLSEIEDQYAFSSANKLSVLGFSATVNYATLAVGAAPFLKITGASQEPSVSIEDGVLTIFTDSCDAAATSSASTLLPVGIMASFLAPRWSSLIFAFSFMSTLTGTYGQLISCTPTIEIEISLPAAAEVTTVFGETDHYLEATKDTVRWGYFDADAPYMASMESGETITVEVVSHHSGHDYAKMIRGDDAVAEIFYWGTGQSLTAKPVPKLPGSGVHLITGPIEVVGAEPGDVVQVDILELDPRPNPETGKTFGTNSQKFAGYQYNSKTGFKRDNVTQYVRTGGTEAITVFEFVKEDGDMLYGKPVYMYRFPNMTAPDGSIRTFDNNPAVTVPQEFNMGYDGSMLDGGAAIEYPEGFDGTFVTDETGILYLSPGDAKLNWKVPLRPHLGTLGVMPSNTKNYIDAAATGGASSIPPSRFGGNVDDWRIGKGGTMFYTVEVAGAGIVVGDTHAAQGDSELAGTAMETSMTTKLRIILHKKDSLPKKVEGLNFPLLETVDQFVIHGFAYSNYLDQLEDASTIFQVGASLDLAMADCFIKTRNWLMDTYDLIEEETIALMSTAVDFGITQVVDGNWGVHADIDKWVFDETDAPYDYGCTTSKTAGRRERLRERRALLEVEDRASRLEKHGIFQDPEQHAEELWSRVTVDCPTCANHFSRRRVAHRMLDAKLRFAKRTFE